jgi:N-acetyl-gamma-glutamyl-phosphate reductase
MSIRVAILGATGYTALELAKILLRHPQVEITALTSRQEGSPAIGAVHPQLAGRLDMRTEDLNSAVVADRADCVFSCLPHGASAAAVRELLDAGCRVVDFSADFRLRDPDVFAQWYGAPHVAPALLDEAVYGLPELFADAIPPARLIANPGCYPTSAALALAPLLKLGLIEPRGIIVDSKSGVSGAGRTPKLMTHFPECNESLEAYNVGQHRHTPEINQTLSTVVGKSLEVIFTPHLVPMNRGILTTAYSVPKKTLTTEDVLHQLQTFYEDKPFVRVSAALPATRHSAHSNFCDISARVVGDRIITVSCLDNLIKGASGQAVQNMNLMYGWDETTGLIEA